MKKHTSWTRIMAAGAALLAFGLGGCGGDRSVEINVGDPMDQVTTQQDYESIVVEAVDGPARTLAENPFEFAWDLPLPAPAHTSWMSPATPGLLYVQLTTGEIHGIDVYSGLTQWTTRPLPKPISLQPYVHRVSQKDVNTGEIVHDDRLYVISGDELFSFDCAYGQLIWRYQLGAAGPYGFQPASGPFALGSIGNLRVYIGDWEGRVQVVAFHKEKSRPYVAWQWNLQAPPTAPGNGMDDLAYIGDHKGQLSCFGLDRELLWRYEAGAPILGSSLVRGRSLYFGSDDDILHVLNRLSGQELGTLYLGASVRRQPAAFNSESTSLYVFTDGRPSRRGLRGIHTSDDNIVLEDVQTDYEKRIEVSRLGEKWFQPGIDEIVASSPGRLYTTREDSSVILAMNRDTGAIDWHWDVQNEREEDIVHITPYVDPSDQVRAVITFDEDGKIVVYRLFGAETRE